MIQLEQYRDPWMSEGFDDYIGFYNREYYCLDNFSAFQIEYSNRQFLGMRKRSEGQNHMGKLWMKLRDEIRDHLL